MWFNWALGFLLGYSRVSVGRLEVRFYEIRIKVSWGAGADFILIKSGSFGKVAGGTYFLIVILLVSSMLLWGNRRLNAVISLLVCFLGFSFSRSYVIR